VRARIDQRGVLVFALGVHWTLVALPDALEQRELLGRGDVVVLVAFQTLAALVQVEALLLQRLQYFVVDGHRVESHYHSNRTHLPDQIVPDVSADIFDSIPFTRVGVQDILKDVFTFDRYLLRAAILPTQYLFVQGSGVRVFKG